MEWSAVLGDSELISGALLKLQGDHGTNQADGAADADEGE